MANLVTKRVVITGTPSAPVSATNTGDGVAPSDRTFLRVKNGSGAAITVTIAVPGLTRYGQAEPDVPVNVPAAGESMIGPLGTGLADTTSGLVQVTYSAVASVTVEAVFV